MQKTGLCGQVVAILATAMMQLFSSRQTYTIIIECDLLNDNYLPAYCIQDSETEIYPVLLGDSAFPFLPWLMKPYGNAIPTKEQGYFNYRLSRARMVVEGAFWQLKGRWRILLRKNECYSETLKLMSLSCIILHNLCIDLEDKGLRAWNLAFDETQNVAQEMLLET